MFSVLFVLKFVFERMNDIPQSKKAGMDLGMVMSYVMTALNDREKWER